MNDKYTIDINYSNKYRNEALSDIIRNMDNLDLITSNLFNNFSQEVNKRKARIENIKRRVNRITSIILFLESLPQGLTFKSRKYYPVDNTLLNGRAHYEYNNNANAQLNYNKNSIHSEKINTNLCNTINILGKCQPLSLEKMIEANQLYTDCLWKEDMKNKISFINTTTNKDLNPILDKMTSAFQWNNTHCNLIENDNSNSDSIIINQSNDTNSLFNESLNNHSIKNNKKNKPFDAPMSLRVKEKRKQYSKGQTILSLSKKTINLDLPMNIKLGNITDVQIEDFHQEEINEQYQTNIINDDIDNSQGCDNEDNEDISDLPVNLITTDNVNKHNKQSRSITTSNSIENKSINTEDKLYSDKIPVVQHQNQPIMPQSPMNSNQLNQPQQQSFVIQSNNSSSIPVPPVMPDSFKLNISIIHLTDNVVNVNNNKPKTVQEEIGDNPIAKLKKIGSIIIEESKIFYLIMLIEKIGNKKSTNTNSNSNLIDLLKQQIQLRFKNLNKHQQNHSDDSNSSSKST